MSELRNLIAVQVARLFAAFERGVKPERASIYVEALGRCPADKLEAAVTWVIEHWEEKSPPSVAKMKAIVWRGSPGTVADDEAERERLKVLLYYLMRYSDADFYEFKRAFGWTPTRDTYAKYAEAGQRAFGKLWKMPEGVTFKAPDVTWCIEQRRQAAAGAKEAFHRLGRKHGAKLPAPEALKAEAERDLRDAQQRAANEELPW